MMHPEPSRTRGLAPVVLLSAVVAACTGSVSSHDDAGHPALDDAGTPAADAGPGPARDGGPAATPDGGAAADDGGALEEDAGEPPVEGFRTMISSSGLDESLWGMAPTPDFVQVDTNGTHYVREGGIIDQAIAAGAAMMIRGCGGNNQARDPVTNRFRPDMWKAKFDEWVDEVRAVPGGEEKLHDAVRSGVFRAFYTLDDFTSGGTGENVYAEAVTYEEIEDICGHAKGIWPWMPLVARGRNTYLRTAATRGGVVRQYHYLDAGWAQYRARDGDPEEYIATEIAAGEEVGLGLVAGANMLNQGAGTTPGWGCVRGDDVGRCGMSPEEIRAIGDAILADPRPVGFNVWAYSFGIEYWSRPEIQGALEDVRTRSLGRVDGPVNIRDDLAP